MEHQLFITGKCHNVYNGLDFNIIKIKKKRKHNIHSELNVSGQCTQNIRENRFYRFPDEIVMKVCHSSTPNSDFHFSFLSLQTPIYA